LFVLSLHRATTRDLGFDAGRLTMATVDFSNTSFSKPAIDAFYNDAVSRVRRLPGVESAALSTSLPFWWSYGAHLAVPGRAKLPVTKDGGPYLVQVTPEYFATAGTRIVHGRGFTARDGPGSPRVAIVSETMAKLIWPGEDALGKCIKVGGDSVPCSNVVGVAHDALRQTLEATPVMQYYVPLEQRQFRVGGLAALVRTRGESGDVVGRIRQTMATIVPDVPFVEVRPLQALVDPQIQPWRIGARVFVVFGLLALAIASVGLYGVIGYEVTQRTHEFGIRAALGASSRRIVLLVLGRGLGLAAVGIVVGVAVARAGARWLQPLLFATSASDVGAFLFVAVTLLGVAVAACIAPAWRAGSADPASALRAE
jgi:predicted permease